MNNAPIARGFRSRQQDQTPKNRLPPGQHVTTDFPIFSAGPTPQIKVKDWTFCPPASRIASWQMELATVRSAPSDHNQDGYPLRNQMVQTRYHMARRDI